MAQIPQIPHLNEVFSLAQFLVADRDAAVELVGRAYSSAAAEGLGRFTLLRALVRTSGILTSDPAADRDWNRSPYDDPPVFDSASRIVPLVGVRAGRAVRDRLLPSVLGTLDVRDRVMIWFAAAGITSASDLGVILGVTSDIAGEWSRDAHTTLGVRLLQSAPLHDRLLIAAAEKEEPTRDAVRRILDTLIEPPPTILSQRLAAFLRIRAPKRRERSNPRRVFRRFILVAGLVTIIAAVGYGIQSLRPDPAPAPRRSVDAVRMAFDLADDARPVFRTSSAEQAEIFVRDRIGWSIIAPAIQGTSIIGVGLVSVLDGQEIPVFFYGDGPGFAVTIVAYTYEFLDRAEPGITLDRSVRQQIGEMGRFSLLDTGPGKALVFRNRDDIFVAVTPGDMEALQESIRFPD